MKMRWLLVAATTAVLPVPVAGAEDLTLSGNVTATTNYVFRSVTNSDDTAALQPSVTLTYKGFYAGIWGSNVDFGAGSRDTVEIDYYVGYSGEIAKKLSFDVNYTRFTYNSAGSCCGEFNLRLDYPVSDKIGVAGIFAYDPDATTLASAISASYAFNDKINVSATLGHDEALGHNYWDAGASYALNDTTSFDLRYYETTDTDSIVALTVSKDFTLLSR